MKLTGAQVLVTGAGGFIASHLAERLVKEGCRVRAMLHYDSRAHRGNLEYSDPGLVAEMEVVSGDVRDAHAMMSLVSRCDAVFHLAALIAIPYSYLAPDSYLQANAAGTLNTMQACRERNVTRIVHTSTSECYGTAQYEPIDERHPLQGQSPYSASKIAADKVVESFHLSFGLPVVTVRPFNTFGPRQSARAVIPTVLSQLVSGRDSLHIGSLEPRRNFNYVTDTVESFVAAARCDNAVGELVNIGSADSISIGELAELAMEVVGRRVPIVTDPQRTRPDKSEVGALVCDSTKARDLLGWSPTVPLRAGLERVAAFISEHPRLYRAEEYTR